MHHFIKPLRPLLLVLVCGFLLVQEPNLYFTQSCDTPTHLDYAPLMALYNATNGDSWTNNTGWGVNCDVCDGWKGILCINGRVNKVLLYSNNLTGYIPEEFFDLPTVKEISLANNKLTGNLPSSVSNASNLISFAVSSNNLAGLIPAEIGSLANLELLFLGFNNFEGQIPLEIGNLSSIKTINLGFNNLLGEIPKSLENLSSLEILMLASNDLSGSIPLEIANINSLKSLSLYDNKLSGSIPSNVGNLSNLEQLWLFKNQLNGSIPASLTQLSKLEKLRLNENNLTGSLPSGIANLSNLEELYLYYNSLEGSLPNDIGNLSLMKDLRINNNSFSSTLPSSIGNMGLLRYLYVMYNDFSGEIPPELGNMSSMFDLRLSNNYFEGQLPDELSNLTNTSTLLLNNNLFSGSFPEFMVNLTSLNNLNLSSNGFEGCFPESYRAFCSKFNNSHFFNNCTFENPSFVEFCSGELCNDNLGLISVNGLDVCEGESVTLSAPSNYPFYEWSVSNSKNRTISYTPLESGQAYITITNNKGCSKIDSIFVNVIPNTEGYLTSEICQGNTKLINGIEYNSSGSYVQIISRAGKCDSTLNISLNEIFPSTSYFNENVCAGSSFELNGQYFGVGSHSQILTNNVGCDSIINIEIAEFTQIVNNLNFMICEGSSMILNGEILGKGNHIQTFTAENGCDSTLYIDIGERLPVFEILQFEICNGQQVEINGNLYEQGFFEQNLISDEGCDSVLQIMITEIPPYEVDNGNVYFCEGDVLVIANNTISSPGIFKQLLTDENQCNYYDVYSVVEIASTFGSLNKVICDENSLTVNGQRYEVEGIFQQILTNAEGCDSILTISIAKGNKSSAYMTEEICEGSIVSINDVQYSLPGQYEQNLVNRLGCDSTIYISIIEKPITLEYLSFEICPGESLTLNNFTYEFPSSYIQNLTNTAGCDSLLHIEVAFSASKDTFIDAFFCESSSFEINGNVFTNPGSYVIETKTVNGCDSIINLNLSLVSGEDVTIRKSICAGQSYSFAGKKYNRTGTFHDSIIVDGCKSSAILELLVQDVKYAHFEKYICEGDFFFFNGEFYEVSGSYTSALKSSTGCDSIVTVDLKINPNHKIFIDTFKCSNEPIYYDYYNYEHAGIYQINKQSISGCDSIINLNIIDYEKETDVRYYEVCTGSSIDFEGQKYFAGIHTGFYFDGICDVNFELTINESDLVEKNLTFEICEGESLSFLDNIYDASGQYLINAETENCEWINYINVVKNDSNGQHETVFLCEGTYIELNGEKITKSGTYLVAGNSLNCGDDYEVSVLFVNGVKTILNQTISFGESFYFHGKYYDEAGTFEIEVGSSAGCSTIIELTIDIQECGGEKTIEYDFCHGEQYTFYDKIINESGIYSHTINGSNGCDSIINLKINFSKVPPFEIDGPNRICPGESITLSGPEGFKYLWNNGAPFRTITVQNEGNYELTIFDENGCESNANIDVKEIILPSLPISINAVNPSTCGGSNGSIIVNVNNPNAYLYSFDFGVSWTSKNSIGNQKAGNYGIMVSDSLQSCMLGSPINVSLKNPNIPQIEDLVVQQINSCQNILGSITVNPSKPSVDLLYSIDEGRNWQSSNKFDFLNEGIYQIQIVNQGSECINYLQEKIEIRDVGNLEAQIVIDNYLSCNTSYDGAATIEILQGQSPFEFMWSTGQSSQSVSELLEGNYTATIIDGNECTVEMSFIMIGEEIGGVLDQFTDTILCETDILSYEKLDAAYNYIVFRNDSLYYEGQEPKISVDGTYVIIAERGEECYVEKHFNVQRPNPDHYGIDFLMSSVGFKDIGVAVVNISDPFPVVYEWKYDNTHIKVGNKKELTQIFTFTEIGEFIISLETIVDGCAIQLEKTIKIYEDSLDIGQNFEASTLIADLQLFKVFPNPNNGQFSIELELNISYPIELMIYNSSGSLIESRIPKGSQHYVETFNLRNVNSGIYSVFLKFQGQVYQKNMMILK